MFGIRGLVLFPCVRSSSSKPAGASANRPSLAGTGVVGLTARALAQCPILGSDCLYRGPVQLEALDVGTCDAESPASPQASSPCLQPCV